MSTGDTAEHVILEDDTATNRILEGEALDAKLAEMDPLLAAAQFKHALRRLEQVGMERLEAEGPDGLRALIEKVHLVAGDRRTKFVAVELDRRKVSS